MIRADQLAPDRAMVLVIDTQEKLIPLVRGGSHVVRYLSKLIDGARVFDLPMLVTEQYPQGLGPTVEPVATRLQEAGAKFLEKPTFSAWTHPPIRSGGGFDHGLLVVHRQNYGNEWFALAALPTSPINRIVTDIIETHWTNLLAQDDWLQGFVNERWEKLFLAIQERPNRYLAKNTEQFSSQWLYKRHANNFRYLSC